MSAYLLEQCLIAALVVKWQICKHHSLFVIILAEDFVLVQIETIANAKSVQEKKEKSKKSCKSLLLNAGKWSFMK